MAKTPVISIADDLKPSQAASALRAMITSTQPVCIWGPPGIGKSQIVKQTSAELDLPVMDIRAVLLDPVDLRGLPHVNGDGQAHWAEPAFLPRKGQGVLFLDELNRAPTLVQNACFQLVLDRQLGEYHLPEGWRVIAACNRETDGGGVTRMPSALANRFVHLNMVADLDDWAGWALSHGIDPVIVAFLRFRPNHLHEFDAKLHAFPTPRSWEFVSGILSQKLTDGAIEFALIMGSVGKEAAVNFESFLRTYRTLPNIDAIIANPNGAEVPTDIPTLYAVSSALAFRATADNYANVLAYLGRLPQEYMIFSVKDSLARDKSLQSTAPFTQWAVKYAGKW